MSETAAPGSGLPCFDPLRPEIQANPHPFWDEYRSRDPVHWSGCPSGRRGRWYVFDYRSASTVLSDRRFTRQPAASGGSCPASSPHAARPPDERQDPRPSAPHGPAAAGAFSAMTSNWLLFQDPPRHTRLRAAVKPFFSLPAAQALRPLIERRVHALLEPLAGRESFDLLKEFAYPLPLEVLASVLGIEFGDRSIVRAWLSAMRDGIDRPKWGSETIARAEAAALGMRAHFEAAWRRHRTQPGKGVLGALFQLEGQEAGLSKEEAFGTFTVLISAGYDTTANLVANAMHLFAQHPRERQRLLEQPELIQRAVEEVLRFESPVQMAARCVTQEVELGNRRLLPGQRVEVLIGSANRDPAVFEAPERFDAGRRPNPHLSFGMGAHYCIGASLARLIGSVALPLLLERVRVQEFAPGSFPWMGSAGFHGLTHLPARFTNPLRGAHADGGRALKPSLAYG
jgi:cytochrome P450 StaP